MVHRAIRDYARGDRCRRGSRSAKRCLPPRRQSVRTCRCLPDCRRAGGGARALGARFPRSAVLPAVARRRRSDRGLHSDHPRRISPERVALGRTPARAIGARRGSAARGERDAREAMQRHQTVDAVFRATTRTRRHRVRSRGHAQPRYVASGRGARGRSLTVASPCRTLIRPRRRTEQHQCIRSLSCTTATAGASSVITNRPPAAIANRRPSHRRCVPRRGSTGSRVNI